MNKRKGFSLVEVVVVAAILAIFASIGIVNYNQAKMKSRDLDRQADLRALQNAVELYKKKYGRYPDGCNGASTWSGQPDADSNDCPSDSTQYIIGHVDTTDWDRDGNTTERFTFAPEFIPVLPADPKINGSDSGYMYTVNTAGTVYKIEARNTVESEVITDKTHAFKSCDITDSSAGICDEVATAGNNAPSWCQVDHPSDKTYTKSYAVWGGYANGADNTAVEQGTEAIICK